MLLPPVSTNLCGAATVTWPAVLATHGPGGKSDPHVHHAIHLIVVRGAPLYVRTGSGETLGPARGVLTTADVPHGIDARGDDMVIMFVDPESEAGARLRAAASSPITLLDEAQAEALWDLVGPYPCTVEAIQRWAPRAIDEISKGECEPRSMHPRVRVVLEHLRTLPVSGDTSIEALAEIAKLSTSRFMHVFTESVGVPLRTFILWRKVQRAVSGIAGSRSLAAVAHDAGFSDAAHMSRTFRRMFGVTPSDLRRQREAA